MKYLIILGIVLMTTSCQDKEPCTTTCPTIDLRLNEEECTCECGYETRWELVKINDRFCADRGSYVCLEGSTTGPHLDTFFLDPPLVVNEFNSPANVLLRLQNCLNGGFGGGGASIGITPGTYYRSYDHGDSLRIDGMAAPDCSFGYQSPPENDLWRAPYRLRFNGYLPDGYESDSLYVKLEYLNWADGPVHEPVEFVMFKVK